MAGGITSVKSIFEFKFSGAACEEGRRLCEAIGNDMPPLDGYLAHEVIRDVADPGHLLVNTHWGSRAQADAVLAAYGQDPKLQRATTLLGGPPSGFVGDVLP